MKLKVPTNDEECRALLRDVCGRTEKQIDAIFEFAKLVKGLKKRRKNNMKGLYQCTSCKSIYEFKVPEEEWESTDCENCGHETRFICNIPEVK